MLNKNCIVISGHFHICKIRKTFRNSVFYECMTFNFTEHFRFAFLFYQNGYSNTDKVNYFVTVPLEITEHVVAIQCSKKMDKS